MLHMELGLVSFEAFASQKLCDVPAWVLVLFLAALVGLSEISYDENFRVRIR